MHRLCQAEYAERRLHSVKMIQIDLSSFPPEKQDDLKKKVLRLAWDDYFTYGHPEILTVMWDYKEPIEKVFPELAQHLTYQ